MPGPDACASRVARPHLTAFAAAPSLCSRTLGLVASSGEVVPVILVVSFRSRRGRRFTKRAPQAEAASSSTAQADDGDYGNYFT